MYLMPQRPILPTPHFGSNLPGGESLIKIAFTRQPDEFIRIVQKEGRRRNLIYNIQVVAPTQDRNGVTLKDLESNELHILTKQNPFYLPEISSKSKLVIREVGKNDAVLLRAYLPNGYTILYSRPKR